MNHETIYKLNPSVVTIRGDVAYDSDGKGDYIAKWEHPTLPKPTDEQLA